MTTGKGEADDLSPSIQIPFPLQEQVESISQDDIRNYVSVRGKDNKAFFIEKKYVSHLDFDAGAMFGRKFFERAIEVPTVIVRFSSDVLEPALNFLRGYSLGILGQSTLFGVWEFSLEFKIQHMQLISEWNILGLATNDQRYSNLRDIMCVARGLRRFDICTRLHQIFIAQYAFRVHTCFSLFEGLHVDDVRDIGLLILDIEQGTCPWCLRSGKEVDADGIYAFGKEQCNSEKCDFPLGTLNLLFALIVWQGTDESKYGITRRLFKELHFEKLLESDIVQVANRFPYNSEEVRDQLKLVRKRIAKTPKRTFNRCYEHC